MTPYDTFLKWFEWLSMQFILVSGVLSLSVFWMVNFFILMVCFNFSYWSDCLTYLYFLICKYYELERVAVDCQIIHRHTVRHKHIDTMIHRQRDDLAGKEGTCHTSLVTWVDSPSIIKMEGEKWLLEAAL